MIVKFSFYGSIGTRQLDGTWEENVDQSSLTTLLDEAGLSYEVVTTANLPTAMSMRHAYQLFVTGRISNQDTSKFTTSLSTLWKKTESGKYVYEF